MFTGIIQDVGRIERIETEPEQTHMQFSTQLDTGQWQPGDSIAVDGCCLTVTAFAGSHGFCATLSPETLKVTCFAEACEGQAVNIEPALRLGEPLGGHWVSGHVDGICVLEEIRALGEHRQMRFSVPEILARYIVGKGSVAINGVSLTVNTVAANSFTVNLIPHTLSHTNLGQLQAGDRANIETDLMGRYVERLLSYRMPNESTETP